MGLSPLKCIRKGYSAALSPNNEMNETYCFADPLLLRRIQYQSRVPRRSEPPRTDI